MYPSELLAYRTVAAAVNTYFKRGSFIKNRNGDKLSIGHLEGILLVVDLTRDILTTGHFRESHHEEPPFSLDMPRLHVIRPSC
ncbi:hypothetical protein QCA50_009727 [Cerrena zonata]|uniref:Uncharacterized protein n=1 Tax=Cerrena zonata TaxID=2478898 RepID=A0AAW0GBD7_9APHY